MLSKSNKVFWFGLASSLAMAQSDVAHGQAVASADVDQIIVTGTRTSGMKAADSPAPIQVIGQDVLQRTGQVSLDQALAQNVPSLTIQTFAQNTSAFVIPVRLLGLNPNESLVLVNGKRRHTTSTLSLGGFAFGGAASADLSFIPGASIARVEVLQEGSAAQYGSDAIAGVINFVQKTASSGGSVSVTAGQYMDGGGRIGDLSFNIGLKPIENSYLNISGQAKYKGGSVRAAPDARTVRTNPTPADSATLVTPLQPNLPGITNNPDYPYLNRFPGDPKIKTYVVTYNGGIDLADDLQLYSFGSYGHKAALAYNVYRPYTTVSRTNTTGQTEYFYPLGFSPNSDYREEDFEAAIGLKGETGGWKWDLASVYGKNRATLRLVNSANIDLYRETGSSPTSFLAGRFRASEWTSTLDVSRPIAIGMSKPMNLAFGLEYRRDMFGIGAGDPASYYKTGSQGFYGLTQKDAGTHHRNAKSAYVDVTLYPTKDWIVDGAVRYEHYSDFGNTTVFKLTSRYDISPAFAVRGTVSTGFRAPTLAEEYYSGVNTTPSAISGQLAPNSLGAALIGINGLKPEKSTNFSVGFVAHPTTRLSLTVDAYQVEIRDRILNTGRLIGSAANPTIVTSPAVAAALAANGIVVDPRLAFDPSALASYTIGVNVFANGLDTRTRGIDVVLSYPIGLGSFGHLDWTLAGNYNETKVTKVAALPSGLNPAVGTLYDPAAIAFLTNASPKFKIINTFFWTKDRLSLNLKGTLYGKSSQMTQDTFGVSAYRETVVGTKLIVDAEIAYGLTRNVKVAIGANNLFNTYPDKFNALLRSHWIAQASSNSAILYPQSSPFGINGGFYYGRLTFSF